MAHSQPPLRPCRRGHATSHTRIHPAVRPPPSSLLLPPRPPSPATHTPLLPVHLHAVDGAALAGLPPRQEAVVHTPHLIPSPCPSSAPSPSCPTHTPAPAPPATPPPVPIPAASLAPVPLPLTRRLCPLLPLRPARWVCPRAAAACSTQQRPGNGGQQRRVARPACAGVGGMGTWGGGLARL